MKNILNNNKTKRLKNNCIEWTGKINKDGYGYIKHQNKTKGAHRVSYLQNIGNIPDGKFICHSCDNRVCINPSHLFLGTHKENMKDMVDKKRSNNQNKNKTICKHGHLLNNNVIVYLLKNGKTMRQCLTCRLIRKIPSPF